MKTFAVMTAGEIRQRADEWFDWDEVHLLHDGKHFPLELGFNREYDCDWTSVEEFSALLDETGEDAPLLLPCDGKRVGVVSIDDRGEPLLVVQEV